MQQQGRREDQQTVRDEDDLRCGEFVSVVLYQRQQVGTEAVVGGGAGHDKGRACVCCHFVWMVFVGVCVSSAKQVGQGKEQWRPDRRDALYVHLELLLGVCTLLLPLLPSRHKPVLDFPPEWALSFGVKK